jgi:hypothetical protein
MRMDTQEFDHLARAMAAGVSRRSVLRRVMGSAVVSPAALFGATAASADGKKKDKNKNKDNKPGGNTASPACRDVGHPCMGNQECCAGLQCLPSGPGSALRCGVSIGTAPTTTQSSQTAVTNNQVCAGNCAQTNQQSVGGPANQAVLMGNAATFGRPPSYWVDADCRFDPSVYQTVCVCTGHGDNGAPRVQKITLPSSAICAIVISEESRPESERPRGGNTTVTGGQASAGNGGVANAEASGGSATIGDINSGGNQGNTVIVSGGRGNVAAEGGTVTNTTTVDVNASGGTASANASGGSGNVAIAGGGQISGQTAAQQAVELSTLTVTLEGQVAPGRQTTYWLETDAGLRPASGPALVQVADETAGAGAVVAVAMACSIAQAQQGYDWFGQCTTPATTMRFSLYPESGGGAPLATMNVNGQGRAYFGNLQPGTYQLKPEGGAWCYAESDHVDANGNVIVEADVESHVWSFTCGSPGGS